MRTTLSIALLLTAACAAAQNAPQPASAATAPAAPVAIHASATLQPALARVTQALADTHLDKWKGSGRAETDADLNSIQRDMQDTLPSLENTSDAAPVSVAAALPVLRNVDALYDVLLRVVQSAKVSAPRNQTAELEQALQSLEDARRTLAEQAESASTAQERRLADMTAALRTQMAAPQQPCTPPQPPSKPLKKKHTPAKKKPAPPVQQQ